MNNVIPPIVADIIIIVAVPSGYGILVDLVMTDEV